MNKKIITKGLIAGVAVSIPMLFTANIIVNADGNYDFDKGMLIGYISMLIAFSLVFVGIRNYRDHNNEGIISFKKAFTVGISIVLIASTVYVLAWLVDYFYFIPNFTEVYSAHILRELKASGASQIEIDKQTKEMVEFGNMYKNPFYNAMMTYMEILPVGLLVSLISSFILKRSKAK